MESILSIHEEVYPLKSRQKKSLAYLSNISQDNRKVSYNRINTLFLCYSYVKKMITQRSLYVLGLFNLILAAVAIICVIQAEDDPEYFSLVYITVSIFIFYMATIVFIIILQIIETYREQQKRKAIPLAVQAPLLSPNVTNQSSPILVESDITQTHAKTRLSRSQTLPLSPPTTNSPSTLSNTLLSASFRGYSKMTSAHSSHLEPTPKYHRSASNITKSHQSLEFTKAYKSSHTYTALDDFDRTSHCSSPIKPIPCKSHHNVDHDKPRLKFVQQ